MTMLNDWGGQIGRAALIVETEKPIHTLRRESLIEKVPDAGRGWRPCASAKRPVLG